MRFAATPPYDGTLTGFWTSPADFCYKLPDGVSLQEGALIEPLAVGVHITRRPPSPPAQSVVVMGAGPVGLLCAAVARAYGASKVVSVDIVPEKLEFARDFAATHTYLSQRVSPEENARQLIEAAGLGDGADAVIDASGAEPSIQTSLHVVRMGGTYVQGGMGRPDITFPIMALCLKEVTAKGSFRYSAGDYRLAIDLVATGKVDVKKLISETVAFADAEEAFKKVKKGQVIKILIAGPNEAVELKAKAEPEPAPAAENGRARAGGRAGGSGGQAGGHAGGVGRARCRGREAGRGGARPIECSRSAARGGSELGGSSQAGRACSNAERARKRCCLTGLAMRVRRGSPNCRVACLFLCLYFSWTDESYD